VTTQTGPPVPTQDVPEEAVRRCPYVGLMPFDEKDAAYFFGRKRESDLIVANLTASRLTLLYASSGVGKSSVLQAGVLPRLHRIADETYEDLGIPGTAVAYVSYWRDAPLESIAAKISAAVSRVPGAGVVEQAARPSELSVAWLREVLRQSRVSAIYLIFDQFEEYLLYHPEDRGEAGLTAELGRILRDPDLRVNVLLSIREDAVAGLDCFKGRVPRLFDNYLRLTHLSRDAAQIAIEGPLDRYNQVVPPDQRMSIEPSLTATLLDQVRTGQVRVAAEETAQEGFAADRAESDDRRGIETPFLQLVLTRLWDEERAAGSFCLQRSTLDRLGGAEKIVQSHLDNVMDELSPAQRDIAAAVFRDLVRPSGAKIALTAQDLAAAAKRPVSAVQDLLDTLSGPGRVLRPLPPAVGAVGHRYEIFHDVMGSAVLAWRRRYINQQEQAEASRRLVAEREEAQVAARAARQRLRRTQFVAMSMVIMLLVAIAFGVLFYFKNRDARQEWYLAQAAATIDHDSVQSLKSAVDAYRVYDNTPARSAVLTAASGPRSQVVAGPKPMMVGMVFTPDFRHVVAYGAHGSIRVIGNNGREERKTELVGPLRGTVTSAAWAAAVSPDASLLALGTDRGTVAVINTTTGRHIDIETDEGPTPAVKWVGAATDGLVLVRWGSGVAATYSPETGKQIARFPGDVREALPLADGQHIVTSEQDGKLRVWDARTATKVTEFSTLPSVAGFLNRYGQSVVGVIDNGPSNSSIVVWDWRAGPDSTHQYRFTYQNGISSVHVDEQAQTIDIAWDKALTRYSLVDGSSMEQLPESTDWINDITGDSRWIITAGSDGRVMMWPAKFMNERPSRPTRELSAHRGPVAQVGYLLDRRGNAVVVSLGLDGTVRQWELPQVSYFDQHRNWIYDMALSSDGSLLATASSDGTAFIVDRHDMSRAVATVTTAIRLIGVRFDPTDPHRVLTLGQSDVTPELWLWGGGGDPKRIQTYAKPLLSEPLVSLAISPNGLMVAGVDSKGIVHLWDARTGALRADTYFVGSGWLDYAVAFDPSSQLIAATGPDGVHVWQLGTAKPLMLLPHPNADGVTFDPSGQRLASTAQDGTVNVWTRDGKRDLPLVAHDDPSSPAFSKDGNLLAVGTAEGLVEVWDVHSGVTLMRDRHHSDSVNGVAFLPDDRSHLISASDDSIVAEFTCRACTDPDGMIRDAEKWAKAN